MAPDSYRVLVIDDDANMRSLLKLLLEHRGHRTLLASDSEVGLVLAEGGQPHLILLDVAMPRRNGLDVYLDLQNHPLTAGIPVLVCSAALTQPEVEIWRRLPHVVEVITKPFGVDALLARVEAVCLGRIAP
jgi:DNA-binding response OmpR family regulator